MRPPHRPGPRHRGGPFFLVRAERPMRPSTPTTGTAGRGDHDDVVHPSRVPFVLVDERPLGRRVVEKGARRLAASFQAAPIAARTRDGWRHGPSSFVPTPEALGGRAGRMFAPAPSAADIVRRAREIIVERVTSELVTRPAGGAHAARTGEAGAAT